MTLVAWSGLLRNLQCCHRPTCTTHAVDSTVTVQHCRDVALEPNYPVSKKDQNLLSKQTVV